MIITVTYARFTEISICLAESGDITRYKFGTDLRSLQDNSPTNQLAVSQVADWITRGLVNSPTANF